MQTTARKAVAVFVAAMLAFAMAFVATPTKAFAAGENATLTIKSTNAEFNNKEVKAWQMFSATATADGANASYTLNPAWGAFFKSLDDFTAKDKDGAELSQAAVSYVEAVKAKGDTQVVAFAKKASDWAKANVSNSAKTATAALSGDAYVATFTGLDYGYYVVSPAGGSTAQRGTDAILANVVKATQEVQLKSEYPTIDKTVGGDNKADASVGDVLAFELKSTVPYMNEYTTYAFNFIDTLSKGLTLDQGSIKVTIGQTELKLGTDYTIDVKTVETDKTQLTVSMKDFKNLHGDKAGQEIKVTYSATLNENAVVGQDDAKNEAKIEYSNDPTNGGTGTSVPDITHGYTFGFDVSKIDADNKTALAGAKFQINEKGQAAIKLIVESAGDGQNPAIVRPAKPEELNAGAVDTVTTPASGKITFKGFATGEYELVETEAPAGYNKLTAPISVKIQAQYEADGTLNDWTVNDGDKSVAVSVENRKGTLLPETGGMGTIAFTVVGALAIVGGVVWAVRRKRNVH